MKLIVEDSLDIETVVELNEATGEKTYVIKGTFSTPELKNKNGRIYPRRIWEENVARYQDEIRNKTKNTLMEKEHPPRTEVDPEKAVARIRKLEMRDGVVYGEAVIFNKPETIDIREKIDRGEKIGVSSRGVGRLNGEIVEEFTLITYDIVKDPSDWNALTQGFNESMILESVEIESDGQGGWICTPAGCTLVESKDITREVEKRLKESPVVITNERGILITIEHKDGKNFIGVDQYGNGIELKSLKGYMLAESENNINETPCQKKAKELKEALEKIANAKNIEEQKVKMKEIEEKFSKYFKRDSEVNEAMDSMRKAMSVRGDISGLGQKILKFSKEYKNDKEAKKYLDDIVKKMSEIEKAFNDFYSYEFGGMY